MFALNLFQEYRFKKVFFNFINFTQVDFILDISFICLVWNVKLIVKCILEDLFYLCNIMYFNCFVTISEKYISDDVWSVQTKIY